MPDEKGHDSAPAITVENPADALRSLYKDKIISPEDYKIPGNENPAFNQHAIDNYDCLPIPGNNAQLVIMLQEQSQDLETLASAGNKSQAGYRMRFVNPDIKLYAPVQVINDDGSTSIKLAPVATIEYAKDINSRKPKPKILSVYTHEGTSTNPSLLVALLPKK